jgi:hypothetical protein
MRSLGFWLDKGRDEALEGIRAMVRTSGDSVLVEDDEAITLANRMADDDNKLRWARKITRKGDTSIKLMEGLHLNGPQIRRAVAEAFSQEYPNAKCRLDLMPYGAAEFEYPDSIKTVEMFCYRVSIRLPDGEDATGRHPRAEWLTLAGDSGSLDFICTEREGGRFANTWNKLARSIPLASNRAGAFDTDDPKDVDRELLGVQWLFGLGQLPVEKRTMYVVNFGVTGKAAHNTERSSNGLMVEEL